MRRWAPLLVVVVAAAVAGRYVRRAPPATLRADTAAPSSQEVPQPARGWLGWQIQETPDGVRVAHVYEGGPAARAGVVAGDVIVKVRGEAASVRAILAAIHGAAIGDEIAIEKKTGERVALRIESSAGIDALLARTIGAGTKALVALQGADGLWPHFESPRPGLAVSALACAALAAVRSESGVAPALERGIQALLARRAADGGIDEPGEIAHRVYANAALILALPPGPDRDGLRAWLASAQITASDPLDPLHGGFRYYRDDRRADISVTAWALEALAHSALPDTREEWARANRFVERCQNFEVRVDPAEAPFRDGGFAFAPRFSKAGSDPVGESLIVYRSYGTATADGVRALVALGARRDARLDAALGWLARGWSLERVPGFPEKSMWADGLHLYWLCSLARALDAARVDRLAGHDWPEELARAVAQRQDPASGSFASKSGLMAEDSPSVATSLALLALAAARDRRAHPSGLSVDAGAPQPAAPLAPWPPGPADAIERGRRLFQGALGCIGCHADSNGGNGPSLVGVADRYLEWKRTRDAAKDYFEHHIRDASKYPGMQADRWPGDRMPHFGEASGVDAAALDALAEFLLSRTGTQPVSEARGAETPALRGNADRGQETAAERNCATCHTFEFFQQRAGKKLDLSKHPALDRPLSPQDVADLEAFFRTLR